MKVTDLKPKELIYCTTVEECKAIQNILHEAGLQWCSGELYRDLLKTNGLTSGGVCYQPKTGSYSDFNWYQQQGGYTFYPASLFINAKPMTTLTLDIAKQMYSSGIPSLKAFAIENYPELYRRYNGYTIYKKNGGHTVYKVENASKPDLIRTTNEIVEAVVALSILMQRCKEPNDSSTGLYYTISKFDQLDYGQFKVYGTIHPERYPLVFFNEDVAKKFYEDNKELLDKAFILL